LKLPDKRTIKRKYELTEKEKQEKKLINEVKRRAQAKRMVENAKKKAIHKILNVTSNPKKAKFRCINHFMFVRRREDKRE